MLWIFQWYCVCKHFNGDKCICNIWPSSFALIHQYINLMICFILSGEHDTPLVGKHKEMVCWLICFILSGEHDTPLVGKHKEMVCWLVCFILSGEHDTPLVGKHKEMVCWLICFILSGEHDTPLVGKHKEMVCWLICFILSGEHDTPLVGKHKEMVCWLICFILSGEHDTPLVGKHKEMVCWLDKPIVQLGTFGLIWPLACLLYLVSHQCWLRIDELIFVPGLISQTYHWILTHQHVFLLIHESCCHSI